MEVFIHYNNETGDWLYSINRIDDPGNWVDSFKTKKETLDYCKENGYTITKIINDKEK